MRTCRKCARALPVSEFSEIPRRFVCRRCRSSFARKKRLHAELADGSRRSWARRMISQVRWDARVVFRTPTTMRLAQIEALPSAVGALLTDARVVPIDVRTGIASYNGVVVDKLTAKCLHLCVVENNPALYTAILAIAYPDARKPIEMVAAL